MLIKFIKGTDLSKETKALLQLGVTLSLLALFLNFQACVWWSIVRQHGINSVVDGVGQQWYTPISFINYPDQTLFLDRPTVQYLTMLYYSVLFIGINEIAPVNLNEAIAVVAMLLVSIYYYTITLSDVAVLLENYGAKEVQREEETSGTLEVLQFMKISEQMTLDILDFYYKTRHSKEIQIDFEEFLSILSPSK